MNIKGILFDLDGTLLDTNTLILESFKHTLKSHLNIEVEDREIINSFGEPLHVTLERYSKEEVKVMLDIYREFNIRNHDSMTKIFEGVESTLKLLKEGGFKLSIVTSKRAEVAIRGLELFNIKNYFDVIITPECTEKHKPNPEPIIEACRIIGVNPSECIMVGDSKYDMLCGERAGAYTCLVSYTAIDINSFDGINPNFKINKLDEILDIVHSI
ncbi:MAG: pyrophosphatase PpaX [Clostridium sp.]